MPSAIQQVGNGKNSRTGIDPFDIPVYGDVLANR